MVKNNLVLFDFDGTITKRDSLFEFIKYYKGNFFFYCGILILLPVFVGYKIKLLRNWQAKQIVLQFFFRGESIDTFTAKCQIFAMKVIPSIVRKNAMDKIIEHQQNGDRVIIVTASAEDWLIAWCQKNKIELIGTRLEKIGGKITGKIAGKNCFGDEKAKRLLEYLELKNYDKIYAYGDSKGDEALLELADIKCYKVF